MDGPTSSILYQDPKLGIILVDIPISIALAQYREPSDQIGTLLSSQPLEQPYAPHDPKTKHAAEKLNANTVESELHAEYRTLIDKSLAMIHLNFRGNWCLPRRVKDHISSRAQTRSKRAIAESEATGENDHGRDGTIEFIVDLPNDFFSSLQDSPRDFYTVNNERQGFSLQQVSEEELDLLSLDPIFHNPSNSPVFWDVLRKTQERKYRFFFPPQSSFVLGNCLDAITFRNAVKNISQEYDTPRRFDLILIDPPYPNASAKRSNRYKTYSHLNDIKRLLLRMDLDAFIEPNGLIGVWITNKRAIRRMILGLFEKINVQLVEEWIWVKTTIKGELVSDLDSLWRKPYEVLLVARAPKSSMAVPEPVDSIRKRAIFGVPDLHSRKPCLKEIFKLVVPELRVDNGLEIFARNLVAGWWSWGNEVLKFNWDGYWERK
ncbi:MT-A70-domain-containing protein [Patellaria atrata CBS 101060]|uniref:MT-A70-domain-containing protein n=1 Tax=Patellaria atrata CBS 101060 TaxID=1346257 RepID=A0A9P4VUQ7_9PEZI|nr:MT-A70-domain-containing protein [Patellaria atrata CBS 101060]